MPQFKSQRIITRSLAVELNDREASQVSGGGPFSEPTLVTEVTVPTNTGPNGDSERQFDQ